MGRSTKTFLVVLGVVLIALLSAGCLSGGQNSGVGAASGAGNAPDKTQGASRQADPTADAKDPETPLFVDVISVTSPVSPGGTPVTLFAKTKPGAICEIKVGYKGGANEEKALFPRQAEENGLVSWTWTIDPSVPFGTYPITITAKAFDGASATTTDKIEVKSAEECKK